jgi:hypothetical protein
MTVTVRELNDTLRDLLCTQAKNIPPRDILVLLNLYIETFRALEKIEDHGAVENKRLMALFECKHRLDLRNGYWLEKQDDDTWWIGQGDMNLALQITGNVPCGEGGSIDGSIQDFANAMRD